MLKDITENVFSQDLQSLLVQHRVETSGHLIRLEKIFALIGLQKDSLEYEGLKCLINEADLISITTKKGVVRDAALIAILQKIKHYEIACYGTMRAYAIALREEDVVLLLGHTLNEEKEADLTLSYIAESHINIEAADKEI